MDPIDLSTFERGDPAGTSEAAPLPAPVPAPVPMAAPAATNRPGRCDPAKKKRNRGAKDAISLPVLPADTRHRAGGHAGKVARSRVGKWRAAVLIGVHVLIAAHILLWLAVGMTVSPVEPSESMYTLESGLLNAGFIFFVLALLSTLVFGRFFCGWGCHVVALQDLCSWVMTKMRIRPKPFRSRLLRYVPLGLAVYMFVWPTFKREVVRPLAGPNWEIVQRYVGESADFPGWSNDLIVRDFWKTFAPWYIAIPFLGVCGFAVVYFLGSKGFCTYGCPYGGFFTPIDRLAPGRIRVNDDCEGCGHCTAVCTSNVRVHEEVRDYGIVVDPGCMKCLDCVSVCPNDALSFGLGRPALLARPKDDEARARRAAKKRQYDLTRPQELLAAVVFLVLLYGYRGMFNQVPLLMAVGMAAIGAFAAWKLLSLLREPHVRAQSLQLKYRGKTKLAGWVFAALAVAYLAAGAWGASVKYHLWRAQFAEWDVRVPQELAFVPGFEAEPADRAAAESAIRHYRLAGPPSQGGFGWTHNPAALIRLAYLSAVVGDRASAESYLRQSFQRGTPRDDLVFGLATLMAGRGATADEINAMYREVLAKHPELPQVRVQLARVEFQAGRPEAAMALHEEALADKWLAWSARTWINAGATAIAAGDPQRGAELARIGVKRAHGVSAEADRADAAMTLARTGPEGAAEAEALLRERIEKSRPSPQTVFALVAVMSTGGKPEADIVATLRWALDRYPDLHDVRMQLANHALSQGRTADAAAMYDEALRVPSLKDDARLHADAGAVFLAAGRADRAADAFERAAALASGSDAEQTIRAAATGLAQAGRLPRAIEILEAAIGRFPHSAPVRADLAAIRAQSGNLDAAIDAMSAAVAINPYDAAAADFLARLHAAAGNPEQAQRWSARAQTLVTTYQHAATLLPQ